MTVITILKIIARLITMIVLGLVKLVLTGLYLLGWYTITKLSQSCIYFGILDHPALRHICEMPLVPDTDDAHQRLDALTGAVVTYEGKEDHLDCVGLDPTMEEPKDVRYVF